MTHKHTASLEHTCAACMVSRWHGAPAEGVCTAECDNLLVVEAHPVEDVPQVGGTLGGIGQAAVGGALGLIVHILPARPPLDVRPCTACSPIITSYAHISKPKGVRSQP